MEAQSLDSLRIKTDASTRSRPSICNMHFLCAPQVQKGSQFQFLHSCIEGLFDCGIVPLLVLRFDRIVAQKLALGSRKLRKDLLQEAIYKHNKGTVGKSKIFPHEIDAIYVYDQAPPSLRRLLKVIWGTEAPQYTAVTLSCISLPLFSPQKANTGILRVQREANPLWYEIARHSWAKIEEMLTRMECKWNMKIKEYLDRNAVPPIYQAASCSPFRDAGKETEVYLMAAMIVHFQSELQSSLPPGEHQKFMQNWRCGFLDSKLLPEVVAMRPDFKIGDIWSSVSQSSSPDLPVDFAVDEDAEESLRLLITLARALKKEQDSMRAHRAAVHRHAVQTIAAECDWQTDKNKAINEAWDSHKVYYQVVSAKNLASAEAFENSSHRLLAGRLLKEKGQVPLFAAKSERFGFPVKSQSSNLSPFGCCFVVAKVPVLAVLNIPMLGVVASTVVTSMVTKMASDLSNAPTTAMYIVIPPNQPPHGTGRVSKAERDQKVALHQSLWKTEIDTCQTLHLIKASGLFDVDSMYSEERDLGIEFWIIMQGSVAPDDGQESQSTQSTQSMQSTQPSKNLFASSVLVKRKAVPGLVQCMERAKMANFAKDLAFAQSGTTHGDADLERSGAQDSARVCLMYHKG